MIARIFILIIILTILPDFYIDAHYFRHKKHYTWWKRLIWWLPCLAMIVYTIRLALEKDFVPTNMSVINVYLFLLGLLVIPKFIFMMFSFIGWQICKWRHTHINIGNIIGMVAGASSIFTLMYGSTIGIRGLDVTHIDFYSNKLPEEFEGYRIVQFTDAHVGSFNGKRKEILRELIDSINAQKGDVIVFTGDLQNKQPSELYPVQELLGRLGAPDGVYSILGNHDYSEYIYADDTIKRQKEQEHIRAQRSYGWKLLLNENDKIYRGKDSIVIAGSENDGKPPFPEKADYKKTMKGISKDAFVIMLQHDPSAWEGNVLTKTNAELTLSGHTHGMQFKAFGWSPASMAYDEWGGLYYKGDRAIYVSTGIGGVVPFRLGLKPEIAVITLHRK